MNTHKKYVGLDGIKEMLKIAGRGTGSLKVFVREATNYHESRRAQVVLLIDARISLGFIEVLTGC